MAAICVTSGDRVLMSDTLDHYVTVLFQEKYFVALDSMNGPLLYNAEDAVTYLWQLVYDNKFGMFKFFPNFITISQK